ncbi:hypothetical protein [Oceanobacillus piezotolerans]|uniref:hypothetical protein n=1 Tax=Oceanobacillus piezotolerans TaxID=2448030 RepID=UPI001314F961|nr:hypothetical protein [Oceanobacillus piezotolerans]
MENEKERIHNLLNELPDEHTLILKEILQAEKDLLHKKSLQGTTIVSEIVNIIKERIKE